ncbi:MAG: ThiF family adenylyltransferase [Sphingobacteriaceae bacterium]|nr:ThiF family adenylyltransferase [Sphingobacteriaceae bacterium]
MDYLDYRSGAEPNSFSPIFFRIYKEDEADAFNLVVSDPDLQIQDSLPRQLKELIITRNPGVTFAENELAAAITTQLNGFGIHEYGVWVLYPWCKRLVHVLDEQEFVELRTSRNKYKITEAAQQLLSEKRVGIVGLSVGSAIALTMAMERSFGSLVLADFDTLDLSNLNRLRARISDIGLNKAVIVAREIAEMDPFLKVEVLVEGVTDENIEAFITDQGGLDLLIDECDSLEYKLKLRLAAKKHHLPVLMETSDRGMLDIERFDLITDLPLFHGRIAGFDISNPGDMPPEKRMQLLMAIVGFDEVSESLRRSYLEIGKSLNTWPQLASAVMMGGGTTAEIARRILLGERVSSGRFYVDMNAIVPNLQA